MDSLLKGILGITPFFDYVLIMAPTALEFSTHLCTVLQWFQTMGLKVKWLKCLLWVLHIDFLGFTMDTDGIHLAQDKICAICNTPPPKNKAKLQTFLGF